MSSKPNQTRRTGRPSATQKRSSKREVTDIELQSRVGLAVRLARTAKGWTQRELADAIGRSQNYVFSLEAGKSDPGIVALRRISEVLDISMDIFLAPVAPQQSRKSKSEQLIYDEAQKLLVRMLRAVDEHSDRKEGEESH